MWLVSDKLDLAGLRVLLAKMSEQPWTVCAKVPMPGLAVVACTGNAGPDTWIASSGYRSHDEDDARGIVAIVNAAGALLDRIEALEAGLREACDVAMRAIEANEILPSTNSEAIARLRSLASPSGAPGDAHHE